MVDQNEAAHLQQQQQELTRQIEVAEQALADAKASSGGATQTLQNQLKGYKDELKRVEARQKGLGAPSDPDETVREGQKSQAHDQANITTVDVEENKRQDKAAAENMANRNKS